MKKLLIAALITVFATSAMAQPPMDGDRMPPPKHQMQGQPPKGDHKKFREGGGIFSSLPADKQEMVRETMKKSREANKVNKDEVKVLFDKKKEIVSAEKFDSKAYMDNAKSIREAMSKSADAREAAFAEVLSKLSADERKAVAAKLGNMAERMQNHDFKMDRKGDRKGDRKEGKGPRGDAPRGDAVPASQQ